MEKLSSNSLMLGDWVLCDSKPYRISQIGDILCLENDEKSWLAYPEEVSPIPLTSEFLEKSGFICRSGLWVVPEVKRLDLGLFGVGIDDGCGVGFCVMPEGEITYFCNFVHELQHALRLCGIEKEVVL